MIHFEGDRFFPLPPDVVADRLGNAAFLVGCLNNVEQVVEATADKAERTGFLKIVSGGLIQAAAKTVIEDTWKAIEAKLQT
jgi:hypothetical protein